MFGRRRRRIAARELLAQSASLPLDPPDHTRLVSDEQLYETVLARLETFLGDDGSWTLVRRDRAETDTIFRDVATTALARSITASIVETPAAVTPRSPETSDLLNHDAAASLEAVRAPFTFTALPVEIPLAVGNSSTMTGPVPLVSPRSITTAPAEQRTRIALELDAIAVWADPQRHDPDTISDPSVVGRSDASSTGSKRSLA